ncbi:23S rRNA pseudouridine(1911/1915/1917) synthase [Bertholletia excelsa]
MRMLSLPSLSPSMASKALYSPSSSCLFPPSFTSFARVSGTIKACSGSAMARDPYEPQEILFGRRANYAGIQFEDIVDVKSGKLRLDTWISSRITGVSRARVQSSIRTGLVSVNGRVIEKVSHIIRAGDNIKCTISELQPLKAEPEDIPLDIVYEDEHVLVVDKPAHMVVHPAPGNTTGTLVNGILHHCSLPMHAFSHSEVQDLSDNELSDFYLDQSDDDGISSTTLAASVRPGIVHRLDKGTSGLLVVAKDEHSHAHLSEQFKQHTIHRVYVSLACGVPSPTSGRVDVPIGRDLNNRIRMAAVPGMSRSRQARHAASRYKVIEILAGGGSALVEWRLETGRTHQIRAHAKYLGIPLLGDEVYGGTKNMAMSMLRARVSPNFHGQLMQLVSKLERPCLHALALGFRHPHTGENVNFSCLPPADFSKILSQLREISEKVS